jgi:hypothetical protein
MKAPLRTKSIGTKVSEEEFAALEECARQADMTLSEWVRAVLISPLFVPPISTSQPYAPTRGLPHRATNLTWWLDIARAEAMLSWRPRGATIGVLKSR